MFAIGKLSEITGFDKQTIRYYESMGLIEKAERLPSGYRQYSQKAVEQLSFVKNAKDLGFSLDEIKDFLDIKNKMYRASTDYKEEALVKVATIEEKIHHLLKMKQSILGDVSNCSDQCLDGLCPILSLLVGNKRKKRKKKS
jgi:MerR family copper efflux transcriptional regulator